MKRSTRTSIRLVFGLATGIAALYVSLFSAQALVYLSAGVICTILDSDSDNPWCMHRGDIHFLGMLWALLGLCIFGAYLTSCFRGHLNRQPELRWKLIAVGICFCIAAIGPIEVLYDELNALALLREPKCKITLTPLEDRSVKRGATIRLALEIQSLDSRTLTVRRRPGCLGSVSAIRGRSILHDWRATSECRSGYETFILGPRDTLTDTVRYSLPANAETGTVKLHHFEACMHEERVGGSSDSLEITIVE